jgi:hypothetical protein
MEELRLHKKFSPKPRKEEACRLYRSLNATVVQYKNVTSAVNTATEIKEITATSGNTSTLASRYIPRYMPLLSDVFL